ncbi:hypothetical protein SprV_0802574100 [Sparganum proliferum]
MTPAAISPSTANPNGAPDLPLPSSAASTPTAAAPASTQSWRTVQHQPHRFHRQKLSSLRPGKSPGADRDDLQVEAKLTPIFHLRLPSAAGLHIPVYNASLSVDDLDGHPALTCGHPDAAPPLQLQLLTTALHKLWRPHMCRPAWLITSVALWSCDLDSTLEATNHMFPTQPAAETASCRPTDATVNAVKLLSSGKSPGADRDHLQVEAKLTPIFHLRLPPAAWRHFPVYDASLSVDDLDGPPALTCGHPDAAAITHNCATQTLAASHVSAGLAYYQCGLVVMLPRLYPGGNKSHVPHSASGHLTPT